MAIEQMDDDRLASVLQLERTVLYKHSKSCSISNFSMSEIQRFSEEHPEVVVYMIEVREQRSLSQEIASQLNVPHESPQVIVVQNGKAVWHASHFDITAGMVAAAFD